MAIVGPQSSSSQCCFCGLAIANNDLLAVSLQVTNIRAGVRPDSPVQGLFAHERCLRSRLDASVPFAAEALLPE